MIIEQTWKSVLEQLQTEMPRASFDTWVRDTKAMSYADGVLTVAAQNEYARDWLESHLVSTVDRMLVGIFNADVRVKFVVAQDDVEVETDTSSQDEEQIHDDDTLEISPAAYDSAYEQIVRPDRAVYLPGYFRRWLRSLGPDLGWMYVSFRQAAYLAGARSGSKSSRFSGKQLASMSGISERTYWNRVNSPATWQKLSGLVKIIAGGDEWVKGPTPRRLPRRYTVAMTLPLTPADTNSLRHWIADHIETYSGAEGVLRAAAEAPLDELIPLSAQPKDDDQALTVRGLLRELFKDELADGLLDSLASALQSHLMPQNDLIVISLFFIEHVLPHLDAGPGWMLILLRDMCYVDSATGASRNRVTVKGGYAEIAGWLGMSRPMTIWEWLHGKEKGFFKKSVLRAYTREVEKEKELGFEISERSFDVLIEDVPHELLELALTQKDIHALFNTENRPVHATFSIGFTRLAEDNYANCTIGFTQFAYSIHATCIIAVTRLSYPGHATFTIAVTPLADPGHATCIVKSSLTLNPTLKTPPTQPEEKTPHPKSAVEHESKSAGVPEQSSGRVGWSFSEIAKNNSLNPRGRADLRKACADEQALSQNFLAWILYAFSPQGKGLTDTTGVGKAVKCLCATQPELAPNKFARLAKLDPQKLQDLFDKDYARDDLGKSIEADIYKANFAQLDPERKSDLYFRLFGKDNPEPAPQSKKRAQVKTFLELQKEKVRAEREARQKTDGDV